MVFKNAVLSKLRLNGVEFYGLIVLSVRKGEDKIKMDIREVEWGASGSG